MVLRQALQPADDREAKDYNWFNDGFLSGPTPTDQGKDYPPLHSVSRWSRYSGWRLFCAATPRTLPLERQW